MKFCCAECGATISEQMIDPSGNGGEWWRTPNPPICPACETDNSEQFKVAAIEWIKQGVQ